MPLFPEAHITFNRYGPTGNAWYILGAASRALAKAGATPEQVQEYNKDAMSSDYEHLISVTEQWVTVE